MLQYNTHNSPLAMPEYGRNVQQMVDHCLTLENRDERNACARAIIDTICRLHPQQRTNPEWRAKLWDHLAIMAGFKLDIDWPVPVITAETLQTRPAKLPLPQSVIPKRVYGINIIKLIDTAIAMDPANPDRDEFVYLLACQMKKLLLAENPEAATDKRVYDDLAELSEGHILIDSESMPLPRMDFAAEIQPANQPRKKKRRRR